MKQRASLIVHPSLLVILLLLVVLSLAAAPVAAQRTNSRGPNCVSDATVMGWDLTAPSGTTFTMTKDCDMFDTVNREVLFIRNGKTFTIDGAGNTIYANDKPDFSTNTNGTVVGFADGSDSQLTLRNVTIQGGGNHPTPVGGDPDPAIIVQNGTLILDNVTIRNTRGGAIRVIGNGKVYVKNSTFNSNRITAPANGDGSDGSVITMNKGELFLQNLLTMKNNTGGGAPIRVYRGKGAEIDIYDLGCFDFLNNADADNVAANAYVTPKAPGWDDLWNGKPRKADDGCDENTPSTTPRPAPTPAPGGVDIQVGIAKGDSNYEGRLSGMIGSQSAYYLTRSGGVSTLQIYRVDGNSVGHWVMDVSQAAVDALGGAGCVASSPDGRYAVRVWADGNVTVSDGPDHENKVFHNTLRGGVNGMIIATETTYSSAPPGMGCPGYMG